MLILTSKGPHFEFICVTMPGLELPPEEFDYGPEVFRITALIPCSPLYTVNLVWLQSSMRNLGGFNT